MGDRDDQPIAPPPQAGAVPDAPMSAMTQAAAAAAPPLPQPDAGATPDAWLASSSQSPPAVASPPQPAAPPAASQQPQGPPKSIFKAIDEARGYGYSDDQIAGALKQSRDYGEALKVGTENYGESAVYQHLGLKVSPPKPPGPLSGAYWDHFFQSSAIGRVLEAGALGEAEPITQGSSLGIGPETESALRSAGIFNDVEKGHVSIYRTFNEAVLRPLAYSLDLAWRGVSGLLPAYQESVKQAAIEVGQPELGRDLAALPEAFPAGPVHELGIPTRATVAKQMGNLNARAAVPTPADIAAAVEHGVIPAGPEGAAPLAETVKPPESEPAAPAAPAVPETPAAEISPAEPAAPADRTPDIHAAARQIAPDVFRQYDALTAQADDLRAKISEARNPPQESIDALHARRAELQDQLDGEKNKAAQRQIRAQMRDVASQIADMTERRQAWEAGRPVDSPETTDMALRLVALDSERGRLGPEVSAAYRQAEEAAGVPVEAGETAPAAAVPPEVEQPAQPAAAAEGEGAPAGPPTQGALPLPPGVRDAGAPPEQVAVAAQAPQGERPGVADDVRAKLIAAGRPAEEADAASQVVEAYYNTRAARFGGAKGSGADLYHADAPDIRGEVTARARQMAQRTLDQSKRPWLHEPEVQRQIVGNEPAEPGALDKANDEFRAATEAAMSHLPKHWQDAFKPPTPERVAAEADARRRWQDELGMRLAVDMDRRFIEANERELREPDVGPKRRAKLERMNARAQARMEAATQTANAAGVDLTKTQEYYLDVDNNINPRYGGRVLEQARDSGRHGYIDLRADGTRVIHLMHDANASTFMHEMGHAWLEDLLKDAADPAAVDQVRADAAKVREWLGVAEGERIPTKKHEKFARSFERYLMEGTAPSPTLARVFAQFKSWLTAIYEKVRNISGAGRINPDIREVFDRMLAEKPERTVIAPESPGLAEAALHEADAQGTLPADAGAAADQVQRERAAITARHDAELHGDVQAERGNAGESAGGGAAPDGGRDAAGPVPREANAGGESASVGAGGNQPAPQSEGTRGPAAPERGRARITATDRVPKEPTRLINFLRRIGGVRDPGGDVLSTIGGEKNAAGVKGLINPTGRTLEDAALRAWEDGYFPHMGERPTINDLLEAMDEDFRGNPVYSHFDADAVDAYNIAIERNAEIERLAAEHSIPIKGVTREQFFDMLNKKLSDDERMALENSLGAELADANARMEADAAAREAMGPARTLEDLERERQQEIAASEAGQRAVGAEQPERVGGGEGGGESGGGQGGGVAEPTGRADAGGAGSSRPRPSTSGDAGNASGGAGGRGAAGAGAGERSAAGRAAAPDAGGDTPSRLIDKAGNIRLELLDTPEDVNALLRQMADDHGGYDDARRGVVSDADVAQIADAIGATGPEINIRKLRAMSVEDGFPLAARIRALRIAIKQQGARLVDIMRKSQESDDPRALFAVAAEFDRLNLIQETLSGITAEVGRGLRAFRDLGPEIKAAEDLGALFRDVSGGRTLDQMKHQVQLALKLVEDYERNAPEHDPNAPAGRQGGLFDKDSDSPAPTHDPNAKPGEQPLIPGLAKFSRDAAKPDFWDKVVELFINNLISNPVTHITYAVGNELMTLWKAVPETMGAALIGSAREAAGMATADRVYWGEVGAGLYALGRGTKAGLMAAGKALWTGKPVLLPKEKSVSLALQERHAGAIGGLAGEVIRSPTRMVAAIHALSRFQNYFISISQQAYRQAMAEGLTGSEFSARVAQLESNPDAKMMGIAQADATNTALMGRGGEFSQAVVRLSNARLMGTKLPKLIVPFAQVSSNIMGQGLLERSPLGLLAPDIRANLRAGGARADTQIARIVAGSALGVVAMMMAVDGNITGDGPSDPKDRAAWLAMGNQPYSIRIGDTWYQYGRLGPISKPIGLAADLWQVGQAMGEKDVAAVAAMISLSMSKLVLDESSMRGIHEALGAVEDPQRNGARWIKQFATSFIPFSQAVGQVAREVDPLDRQARSLLDAFQSRIPGLSEGLPARIDVFGQPVPQRTSLGGLGITSIYTSRETNDPTIRALADLQLRGVPVWPAMPKAQIQGVQLSDRQYEEYAMMTGKLRKQLLDTYVANPSWQANVPDGIKAEQIRGDMERARMMAEQAMLRKPNGIAQAATAYKIEMMRTGRRQPVTTE